MWWCCIGGVCFRWFFFFSSRRRHTRLQGDWSSDVCSSDLTILRAVDYGSSCVVEAEVFPAGSQEIVKPGPYTFADASQATAFVTEAIESLIYLGCDIYDN